MTRTFLFSSGRLAKLEGELAMHKKLVEEMKKTQVETDDFVQELDEDMEGMQVRPPTQFFSVHF